MKKTIIEDFRERYLKSIFIHDNALLIFRKSENDDTKIEVAVRFVDNNVIKEQVLTTLDKSETDSKLVEINDTGTAIAIYKKENEERHLDRIYSLEDHFFALDDFMDLEYQRLFPEKQAIKKRGLKNVKH